jgi:hypothetical protein
MYDCSTYIEYEYIQDTSKDYRGINLDIYFRIKEKMAELRDYWPDVRMMIEFKFKLMIALMTNVFAATFYRRASFSKSGFIGRTAKRRKGRG